MQQYMIILSRSLNGHSQMIMYMTQKHEVTPMAHPPLSMTTIISMPNLIFPPLPEQVKIGEHLCQTWYASRHRKRMRCKVGHHTNDVDRCDSYTTPLEYVKIFSTGPFSNFNRCTIDMRPLTFITSQHAYQFRACKEHIRADLAEKSRTPYDTKIIVSSIKDSDPYSEWNLKKLDAMREVPHAKLKQLEKFRKEQIDSEDKLLIEVLYFG